MVGWLAGWARGREGGGRRTRAHCNGATIFLGGWRQESPKDSPANDDHDDGAQQKARLMLDIDNNDCIPTCFMSAPDGQQQRSTDCLLYAFCGCTPACQPPVSGDVRYGRRLHT